MLKRILDLLFSVILIILAAIPMGVVVFLIKINAPGPVLFVQQRVGKNKRLFPIYKFRTMRTDTPKDVPTHLLGNPDAYITSIGKFLRRTSIDELPQLFNIFLGHMSFVGPRPALYNQDDLIALRDQYNINAIRPGLTGWAQVNGRDELPIPVKVSLDHYYYQNMSLLLDIKIIFKTITSVFKAQGVREGKGV
ncbi:MAG: sugar transferase [Christensenellales bacterium]|jgi:O-antigen biosynthesis protein WbqP